MVLPHISPLVTIHLRQHGVLLIFCIRRMVSMIEPTKGPALLLNLLALQVYPALDSCEA